MKHSSRKTVLYSSTLYIVGDALSRGMAFLLLPVLALYLSPAEYGIVSLAITFSVFLSMLISFRGVINRFYYQYEEEKERRKFFGTFWVFLIIVSVIFLLLISTLGRPVLKQILPSIPFHLYLWIILLSVFFKVAFQYVLLDYYQAKIRPQSYLIYSFFIMLLTNGAVLFFVVVRQEGALGYLTGELISLGLIAVISSIILLKEFRISWDLGKIKPVFQFSLPLIPHYLFHWMLGMSDRLILNRFGTLNEVGIYSLGYQFALVLQLFFTSINKAFVPIYSQAASSESIYNKLSRLITYYFMIVLAMGTIVILLSNPILDLLFPADYQSVKPLIPWLVLGVVFVGLYFVPMNLIAMTSGKTSIVPRLTFVAAVVNLSLNFLLIPRFGMFAAAVNTAVGYGVLFVLILRPALKIHAEVFERERINKIVGCCVLIAGLGFYVLRYTPFINLILALVLICVLPLCLWLFGFWKEQEVNALMKSFRRKN